jgi:transposase-like protein
MSYEPVFVICPACQRNHMGRKVDSPIAGVLQRFDCPTCHHKWEEHLTCPVVLIREGPSLRQIMDQAIMRHATR